MHGCRWALPTPKIHLQLKAPIPSSLMDQSLGNSYPKQQVFQNPGVVGDAVLSDTGVSNAVSTRDSKSWPLLTHGTWPWPQPSSTQPCIIS